MRAKRLAAVAGAMAVLVSACATREDDGGAGAGSGATTAGDSTTTTAGEPLAATEVGVSEDEIRIAVLADVENTIIPGLFKGAKDAMEAFEGYVNDTGGIAGRRLVVEFLDTKLNPDETRNAMLAACERAFALVGTTAVFFNSVEPIVECKDLAGEATGLPDLAALMAEPAQQGSPVSYSPLPPERDFSAPEGTQRFNTRVGAQQWYVEQFGDDLHGLFLNSADSKSAAEANASRFYAIQELVGIEADAEFAASGLAPQNSYGPYVQSLKGNGSTYATSGGGYQTTVKLRKEANVQGVDTVKAWDCTLQCYDPGFLEEGGPDVEGTYVTALFVPFEEADVSPAIQTFLDAVGEENADAFAIQAWASGLLFRDAVETVVESEGPNGLTRAALLEALSKVDGFDADGILGPTDVGARVPSSCFIQLQVQDGEYVRVHPEERGTFDCDEDNVVTFEADIQD